MHKGQTVSVYQDGKSCRDHTGYIKEVRAQQVLIVFEIEPDEGMEPKWFQRRDKCGKYECKGWNYFFYDFNREG